MYVTLGVVSAKGVHDAEDKVRGSVPLVCCALVTCFSSRPDEVPVPVRHAVLRGSGRTLGSRECIPQWHNHRWRTTLQSREEDDYPRRVVLCRSYPARPEPVVVQGSQCRDRCGLMSRYSTQIVARCMQCVTGRNESDPFGRHLSLCQFGGGKEQPHWRFHIIVLNLEIFASSCP